MEPGDAHQGRAQHGKTPVVRVGQAVDVQVATDQDRLIDGQAHDVDQTAQALELFFAYGAVAAAGLQVRREYMNPPSGLVDARIKHALVCEAVAAAAERAERELKLMFDRPAADDGHAAILPDSGIASEYARLMGIVLGESLEQRFARAVAVGLLQQDNVVPLERFGQLRRAFGYFRRDDGRHEYIAGQDVDGEDGGFRYGRTRPGLR